MNSCPIVIRTMPLRLGEVSGRREAGRKFRAGLSSGKPRTWLSEEASSLPPATTKGAATLWVWVAAPRAHRALTSLLRERLGDGAAEGAGRWMSA